MTDYAAAELLETETGQEMAQKPPTLPVCVTGKVITEEVTAQDVSCYTITLTTTTTTGEGTGIAELLPADPLRTRATVVAVDVDVVICHSRAQVNDSSNTVTNVPNPDGAYLPKGLVREIRTTKRMWVAAISSSANRISVIVERRQP